MPLPFRAIAFDIDDTLTESKQSLKEEMGILLSHLTKIIPVAIISGAKKEQIISQIVEHIKEPKLSHLYLFPSGGAAAYSYTENGDLTVLYELLISKEEANEIIEKTKKIIEDSHINYGQTLYGEVIEHRDASIAISLLGQHAPPDVKKDFDPDQSKRKALLPLFEKEFPQFSVAVGGWTTIDINRKGIDKAYAIRKLTELLKVSEGDILYVGDALFPGGNDSAVMKTRAQIHPVKNPEDTKVFLGSLLHEATI